MLVNMSIVILRYFGSDVLIVRWRLVLRLVSFIFILNVDLALQPSTDIGRDNQATRPVLVVGAGLPYHVERVGACEWLCGSTRKIQRLLDSILTDICSSKLLNLPVERRATSIVQHSILRESRRRIREQLLVVLWECAYHLILLVGDQWCLPLLRERLLSGIVHPALASREVEEARILRCLHF